MAPPKEQYSSTPGQYMLNNLQSTNHCSITNTTQQYKSTNFVKSQLTLRDKHNT